MTSGTLKSPQKCEQTNAVNNSLLDSWCQLKMAKRFHYYTSCPSSLSNRLQPSFLLTNHRKRKTKRQFYVRILLCSVFFNAAILYCVCCLFMRLACYFNGEHPFTRKREVLMVEIAALGLATVSRLKSYFIRWKETEDYRGHLDG